MAQAMSTSLTTINRPHRALKHRGGAYKLFGQFLVFVYHCFDRIVIHGYLTALSRPELVVHVFRDIVGVAEVSKEVLSQRTNDYQRWVEAYARNHSIPIEWAEKGVRKEDHVLPWRRLIAKKRLAFG